MMWLYSLQAAWLVALGHKSLMLDNMQAGEQTICGQSKYPRPCHLICRMSSLGTKTNQTQLLHVKEVDGKATGQAPLGGRPQTNESLGCARPTQQTFYSLKVRSQRKALHPFLVQVGTPALRMLRCSTPCAAHETAFNLHHTIWHLLVAG